MRFYDLLIETNRELVGEPDPGGNVDRSRFGYGKRYNLKVLQQAHVRLISAE